MIVRLLMVGLVALGLVACRGGGASPATVPAVDPSASAAGTATRPPAPAGSALSLAGTPGVQTPWPTTQPLVPTPAVGGAGGTPTLYPTRTLPAGCDEAAILGVDNDFVAAFNRGDQAALARLFPAKGTDGDHPWSGDPNQLRWFTLNRASPSRGVDALNLYTPEVLLTYFAERHAQHERMWMVELVVNAGASGPGSAAINFRVGRIADDLPELAFSGKGGVSCQHGVIFLWSQGGSPAYPATPPQSRP